MKRPQATYPLRLPHSVKAAVERLAKADGVSVNQFLATAVAEKLSAMNTAAFFAERREKADFAAFDQIMRRKRGEAPGVDDSVSSLRGGILPARSFRLVASLIRGPTQCP